MLFQNNYVDSACVQIYNNYNDVGVCIMQKPLIVLRACCLSRYLESDSVAIIKGRVPAPLPRIGREISRLT